MVGGLGSRLRPLTNDTPKPMLRLGNRPLLHDIVEKFKVLGFRNFVMCTNYKSHVIKDYFGDGKEFEINIEYIEEKKRMGTVGALSLLKEKPDDPFFVMNGDLVTNLNFDNLLEFHNHYNADATMCLREYAVEVPYGVVNVKNVDILSIEEKPIQKTFINAGIYVLDPVCIDLIPRDTFYNMPTLFQDMISKNKKTISFPLQESWSDIGTIFDYESIKSKFHEY